MSASARIDRAEFPVQRKRTLNTIAKSRNQVLRPGYGRPRAHSATIGRVARVLVVEDNLDIANLIKHYVEGRGHTIDHLASGREVLPRVRQAAPDLIVLDLMLPGMDGLMVCQALRQDAATAAIPVIMLTARGEESDRI